ncbi:hypothetical protein Q4488_00310 [Amphritea sp. 1_MG-2023]|uniref:hypothetical protein n=1 Tax=Amphritea sp. 1_MG-2023 TaxID=3062670 RepID=UPI0026E3CBAA|nr:hypothetical protein [Amphritea sp. 1_MG-2023]MDO6561815.1 hypothetical protein [Amphritea sp. 1_MG-2023]
MKTANSANEYSVKHHRLIEHHEIIHFQDPHCPIQILTEEATGWIATNNMLSLEHNDLNAH